MSQNNKTEKKGDNQVSDKSVEAAEMKLKAEQLDKEKAEKEAKEKAAAEEKLRLQELQQEKRIAKVSRKQKLQKRAYQPKKGTGKLFHLEMELLSYKDGEKVSKPFVKVFDLQPLLHWLKNSVGYSIHMKHDPLIFYPPEVHEQVKNALKQYMKRTPSKKLKYTAEKLIKDKNTANKMILDMYAKLKKREEYLQEQQKKKSVDDWLD